MFSEFRKTPQISRDLVGLSLARPSHMLILTSVPVQASTQGFPLVTYSNSFFSNEGKNILSSAQPRGDQQPERRSGTSSPSEAASDVPAKARFRRPLPSMRQGLTRDLFRVLRTQLRVLGLGFKATG